MRYDAEKYQWSNKVPGDRTGLVPLCNAEPTQRRGRQCAVGRGASEGHPAYTQRPGQTYRNTAHTTGCRSQDPVKAFKPTNRESFVYGATVIEARYHKGVNKGGGSSWRERAGYHSELPK